LKIFKYRGHYLVRKIFKYRVIHKSLRDFRLLRSSSRDGHAEGEHVNRGRDTPSFCPTLQVLDMSTLGDVADVNPVIKFLPHTLHVVGMLPFGVTIPATVPQRSEIPEGLTNYPVCYVQFESLVRRVSSLRCAVLHCILISTYVQRTTAF
jgi:hypothetical protein